MGASFSQAEGRVAVISGGGGGIGLAAARQCVGLGMKIVLADIDEANLAAAASELNDGGAALVKTVVCDVSDEKSFQNLHGEVYGDAAFGECGFLFLNAGLAVGSSAFTTSMDDWKLQLGVNLYGVLHGLQLFTPSMLAQDSESHITATSSFAGLLNTSTLGLGAGTPYTVSKHAVTLTMEAMAHELRNIPDCKVQAHLLCPAAVASNYMQAAISNSDMDDATKVESAKAVSGMQTNALPPDQMASILLSEMAASKFYVIGFDAGQPKEMLHAMLQWRVDDIVEERNPLSHLVRGDDPVGKDGRATIKGAIAEGQRNLQKASL